MKKKARSISKTPLRSRRKPGTQAPRRKHQLDDRPAGRKVQKKGRRAARAEVAAGLEHYKNLYDFAPVGYFSLTRNGTIRLANHQAARLVGVEREELAGRRFGLLLVEGGRSDFRSFLARVFASDTKQTCRLTLKTKGRPATTVLLEAARSSDGDECLAALIDIPAPAETEAKLAASERHLRAIFDTEPECVKLLAEDGSLLEMNPAGLRMLEADSFQQVRNRCVYPLVTEEHRAAFRELTEEVFRGESGSLEFEMVGLKGRRRWLEIHATPLRNAAGKIISLLAITRDISRRRQMDAALRASEERFSKAFRLSPDAIALWRVSDKRITDVNESFERISGFKREELIGRSGWESNLWVRKEDRDRYLTAIEEHSRVLSFEAEFRLKSGEHRLGLVSGEVLEFGDEPHALSIIRDITERKRAEQALRFSSRRLELIARMTDAVIGNRAAADVAQGLAVRVRECFEVDTCVIRILEDGQLVLIGAQGIPPEQLQLRLPVFGIAEQILTTRQPAIIPDVRTHPLTQSLDRSSPGTFSFVSYAGVPLIAEDKIVGLLGIYKIREPHTFTAVDVEHLGIVANHIAVSLSNERLFNTVKDQKQLLENSMAERRRSEEAVRQSEARYRMLVERMGEGLLTVNNEDVIQFANQRTCEMFGYALDEMLGRNAADLLCRPEDHEPMRQRNRDRERGLSSNYEIQLRSKSGEFIWCHNSGTPTYGSDGVVTGSMAIITNISERKRAELALREAEATQRSIMESSTDFILLLDRDANIQFINRTAHGVSRERVINTPIYGHVEERFRPAMRECFARVLSTGEPDGYQTEYLTPDGGVITYEARVAPVGSGDQITGLTVVARDISDRMAAEVALLESQRHYKALFQNAPDAVFLLAADPENAGRILAANDLADCLHGYAPGELVGKFISEIEFPESDRIAGEKLRLLAAGERINFEAGHRRKDGSRFRMEVTAIRLTMQGRPCVLEFDRDITERIKAGEALRQSEARFRLIVESNMIGILFWNANGDITEANDAFLNVVGHTREDLETGKLRWRDMTPPEYQAIDNEALHEVTNTGTCTPYEKEYFRKDGSRVPILIGAATFPDQRNLGVAFLLDMTERNKTQQARDHSLSLTRATLESTADGILVVNLEGKIETFNRVFTGMWQVPDDVLAAKDDRRVIEHVLDQLSAPLDFLEKINHLYAHPEEESFDKIEFKDGRVFERYSRPQHIGGQAVGRVWSFRDITDRRRAERRQTAFATLGRRLNAADSAAAAGRIIAQIADELLGWDSCMLDMYDVENDCYESILTMDIVDGRRQDVPPARATEIPSARMRQVLQGGPRLILRENPLAESKDFTPFGDANRPSASLMFVPVLEGGKPVGVLSIQSYRIHAYTNEDLNALQDLADHGAGALERLRKRDALRASEAKYRTLIESASDGILVLDARGQFVDVNAAACRMFGYTPQELLNLRHTAIVAGGEVTRITPEIARLNTGGVVQSEWNCCRKDGSVFPVEVSATALPDGRMLGIVRDITTRKQAEEAIRRTEQLYRQVIAVADAVPYEYDYVTRQYQYMGDGIKSLTGHGPEEFSENLWNKIIQETVMLGETAGMSKEDAVRSVLRGDVQYWRADMRILTRDGRTRWLADVSVQKLDAAGHVTGSMGILQDITDRKLAEQRLRESREQLRSLLTRLQKAQEDERIRVAREIHDELGQLLTGLKMDVRWLERKLTRDDLPPELQPLLDRAVGASELADQTIGVVQKIAADLRPGALDSLGLAAALIQRARRFQERTGISCEVTGPDSPPALPPETATELYYICQEALTNVMRHADATSVRIRLEPTADGIVLEIRDDGRGFTEVDINRQQSLGMLGMRERAAHFGGNILWEPLEPHGTSVTVHAPLNPKPAKGGTPK